MNKICGIGILSLFVLSVLYACGVNFNISDNDNSVVMTHILGEETEKNPTRKPSSLETSLEYWTNNYQDFEHIVSEKGIDYYSVSSSEIYLVYSINENKVVQIIKRENEIK